MVAGTIRKAKVRAERAIWIKSEFAKLKFTCPVCNELVTTQTLLNGYELQVASANNAPIRMMHPSSGPGSGHEWNLYEEHDRLRDLINKWYWTP